MTLNFKRIDISASAAETQISEINGHSEYMDS